MKKKLLFAIKMAILNVFDGKRHLDLKIKTLLNP